MMPPSKETWSDHNYYYSHHIITSVLLLYVALLLRNIHTNTKHIRTAVPAAVTRDLCIHPEASSVSSTPDTCPCILSYKLFSHMTLLSPISHRPRFCKAMSRANPFERKRWSYCVATLNFTIKAFSRQEVDQKIHKPISNNNYNHRKFKLLIFDKVL